MHLKNKFGRYAHKDIRHLLFTISIIQTIISLVFGQYVIWQIQRHIKGKLMQ